ncbi:MAG: acetylglutamate kinase [Gammaproteobacteria bacterium]|nr:MAG: acetylglutamate kinase [Pseudomonadota bacterium]MCE7896911.1 acetylglutamate kinase [Gammaproteobacteria bacterium PRO8]MCL4777255.1 acetylglutamate kinase [Gammaproteobacteria bacterium]GIK35527.1 MAG: acetylglutamate kinase [Gammaproteobacteria bacterium]
MPQNQQNRDIVVAALRHAAPYVRLYRRKTFVIKAGGEVFADAKSTRALIEQLAILHQVGIRTVLVHGGGPQNTQLAESLGIETRMVEGRRVTDERTLGVATMVLNGQINTQIVAACRQLELPAIGVSGVDAGLIRARKRPPATVAGQSAPVDYGFVGDIECVDPTVLRTQLENGLLPVVSPLSADADGTLLNINADTVAAALASSLGAAKLVLATGAPGILEDRSNPSSLVSYLDLAGLERLEKAGSLADGMLPKARAIAAAIRGGVSRVHVISYKVPDSLLLEIFTNEGTGTLVVENINTLSKAEKNA